MFLKSMTFERVFVGFFYVFLKSTALYSSQMKSTFFITLVLHLLWCRDHPDIDNVTTALSENLYYPSLLLYLISISTDIDETLRREKKIKKKEKIALYEAQRYWIVSEEENAAGDMST